MNLPTQRLRDRRDIDEKVVRGGQRISLLMKGLDVAGRQGFEPR
jgi:hypothetical protein